MKETCLVIGGGVIGMMCARELQAAGFAVSVLERGETGCESSWAAGGILSPMYPWQYPDAIHDLALWSAERYADLAEELREESGIDPEWRLSGMAVWDTEEADWAIRWAHGKNLNVQLFPCEQLLCKENQLAPRNDHALWFPGIAQIRPPRLMKALRRSLKLRGIAIREQHKVESFYVENNRVTGVWTSQGLFPADWIVLACGAWSSRFLQLLGLHGPMEPVRGQMILYRAQPEWLSAMVQYQRRYLIPRRDGFILAGSTVEYVGFDKSTTPDALKSLRESAEAMMPVLKECPIEHHWAGLRPGMKDDIPWIGPHPTLENLFINTGHFRNGIIMAPASARLLTDLIQKKAPVIDPEPYQPSLIE